MKIRQLFEDEQAVSPVIGVILMVAITVILAAVIGTFVLGLGDQVASSTPQVSFSFETVSSASSPCALSGSQDVEVTHDGGDSFEPTNVELSNEGSSNTWDNCGGGSSEVTAGTTAAATTTSGTTLRVIYDNPDNDKTSTIGRFDVP